jgi:23S rRNA (uracil1939-C5)-methyltransferase
MAADEVFKTRIEGIAAGGSGLAKLRGKNIFIEGCAAGELVVCRVSEEHRSWARAELVEIIEPSPDRMPPACALYGLCGGCNLQHLRYEAQLAAKSVILQDAFMRIGGCSAPQPLVFPSWPWEYRNRMQLHRLGSCQRGTGFGLKGRRSGEVTAIPDCPAADPGIRELLRKTAQGETVIPLPPEKNRVTVYARQGLLLSEGGTRRGLTRLLGQDLALDAGVFFQSNAVMLEQLIADLRELAIGGAAGDAGADRNRAMADLFCGVGTFARFLAPFFPRSDLVEENKTALALARENLAGCEAEFFALRDDDWVKTKSGGKTRASPAYGFIVVDPPRQGLSPALSTWLAAEGPPLLAYVSCDPATLARDSGILVRGGYEIAELRLYDFYPQTAHIESLAVFRKKIL